jgi:hypothetical protein
MFGDLKSNLDCGDIHFIKKTKLKKEKSSLSLLFESIMNSDEGNIILEFLDITSILMTSMTNKEIKNSIDNTHKYHEKFPKKSIFSTVQKKQISNKLLTVLFAGDISIRGFKNLFNKRIDYGIHRNSK